MKRYYSQTTGCTYLAGINTKLPTDIVEITEAVFLSVFCNPAYGKMLAHDSKGAPYLVDAPAPAEDLEFNERAWRDVELSSVMWLRERHRDQLEISETTTLTPEQFNELLVYMQALRDWPQSSEFPAIDHRPIAPDWIAEQAQ
jgi:hypothetical protein